MKQQEHDNKSMTNDASDEKATYTNTSKPNQYDSVEPLPESSRPRRDGPGGEDGE